MKKTYLINALSEDNVKKNKKYKKQKKNPIKNKKTKNQKTMMSHAVGVYWRWYLL